MLCRSLMVRKGELMDTDTLCEVGMFGPISQRGVKGLKNNIGYSLARQV